jgi:hypothetical protein
MVVWQRIAMVRKPRSHVQVKWFRGLVKMNLALNKNNYEVRFDYTDIVKCTGDLFLKHSLV